MTVGSKGTERASRNEECRHWKCDTLDTLSSRAHTEESVDEASSEQGKGQERSRIQLRKEWWAAHRSHLRARVLWECLAHLLRASEANGKLSNRKDGKASRIRNFKIKISRPLQVPIVGKGQDDPPPHPSIKRNKIGA